jgi:LPXTG-motif cell wall-anchored protein
VPRRRIAALIATLALAAPGTALAQSAGDEQYQDPFGGDGQNQGGGSETPSASGGAAQATPTPTSTVAPTPATAPVGTSPAAQQLPRTGGDPELPAIAGAVLLAGGVALRLRLRRR